MAVSGSDALTIERKRRKALLVAEKNKTGAGDARTEWIGITLNDDRIDRRPERICKRLTKR